MALPGALIQHIEQKRILGNNVCGSTYSLNCSVLNDICTSEAIEQPRHTPKLDVKGKEKLKCAGSLDLGYGSDFNDPSMPFTPYPLTPSTEVGLIADSPKKVEPIKRVTKKKNKRKGKPAKKSLEIVVSEAGSNKYGQDNAIACHQSSKEEIGNADFDKCLKNYPPTAVETTLCASENTVEPSKDSGVHDTKKDSDSFRRVASDCTICHLLCDGWSSTDCEASALCKDLNLQKLQPEVLSTICSTEHVPEGCSFGCSTEFKSEVNNIMSCEVDAKTDNQCSNIENVNGVNSISELKLSSLTSQNDAVTNSTHHPNMQNRKVNCDLIWQKSQKDVKEGRTHGAKRSNPNNVASDVNFLAKNFWVEPNSFSSEGLLPPRLISSSANNSTPHGIKEMGDKEQAMCKRIHGPALANSQWTAQRRLNDSSYQYVSHSTSQVGSGETDCEKLKENQNNSFMHENGNNGKKGVRGCKPNFFRHRNKCAFSQKESMHAPFELQHYKHSNAARGVVYSSQNVVTGGPYYLRSSPSGHVHQNVTHVRKLSVTGQGVLNEIQPDIWAKIPKTDHGSGRPPHAFVESEKGNTASSELKVCYEDKFRQDVPTQMILKKWIPVGRKEPSILGSTDSLDVCNNQNDSMPFSLSEPASTSSDPGKESSISNQSMTSVESEAAQSANTNTEFEDGKVDSAKDNACSIKLQGPAEFLIGSQMAVQALNAAYRLHLLSESVQLATGCPLAEFEKLLQSATPVVASSFVHEKCDVCSDDQLSHGSLCKHQIPNISLRAVWNWYEKPGNYGLEVKAQDSRSLKGLLTDPLSFHAHFVPFLSAVQLFCHPQLSQTQEIPQVPPHSSSEPLITTHSQGAKDTKHIQEEIILPLKFGPAQELNLHSFEVSPWDGNDPLSHIPLPAFSSDNELVFEFFESEQPQLRKPLHNKIMELINTKNSNHQVFGDPSKLACMKLHDIHPASWFSVAWYPIYRIPEGNFRASFLTYHSLGHLVHRCNSDDSLVENDSFHIVFPVLGLQSYNAQGECWFDPKIPVDASSKDPTLFNSSETLKERLRTLQENASLFARGCVSKNHVRVVNRQPDYEFFISRKC